MTKSIKNIINNFLPWDQYFEHFCIIKKFKRSCKIWQKEFWKNEYIFNNYFNYNWQMLENKKEWSTELYNFVSFNNIISWKFLVFLKFENIENYKIWRNKKPKKSIIKKVYHNNWIIQVNLEIWNIYFHKIKYFDNLSEIWLLKASQLNLTV